MPVLEPTAVFPAWVVHYDKEIAGGGALLTGVHFLDIVMYCCQIQNP